MPAPTGIAAVWLLLKKELLEAVRDRNLVIQLFLVPLFLYPLMGFGAYQVYLIVAGAQEKQISTAWIDGDVPQSLRDSLAEEAKLQRVPTPPALDRSDSPPSSSDYRQALQYFDDKEQERPSALLSWFVSADSTYAQIYFDGSRDASRELRSILRRHVSAHADSLERERAFAVGLSELDLRPFELENTNTASARQMGRYILSLMLPFFLMAMLGQGAFYTSLDAVVGERERNTMETLFSAPLDRTAVFTAKLIYVVMGTLATFSLNLLSLVLFLTFAVKLIDLPATLSFQIPASAVLVILGAALLAGLAIAAAMMVLVLPAKNYREGQSSLTPLYLVVTFSSFVVFGAGQEMTTQQALIPIVNVVALCKAALGGNLSLTPVLITYAVLAVVAMVCISIAARIASREGVFFDPELSLKKLLRGGFKS